MRDSLEVSADQRWLLNDKHARERNSALLLASCASDALKLKEMDFFDVWSLVTNAGYFTSNQRQREIARTGYIPPRRSQSDSLLYRGPENSCSNPSWTVNLSNITCLEEPALTATHSVIPTENTWNLQPGRNMSVLLRSGVLLRPNTAKATAKQMTKSVFGVSSTSNVFTLLGTRRLSYIWNPQVGARWEVVQCELRS